MAPVAAPLDPLTEIATPESLRDWLDGLDLADLAPAFIERGLLGQALLEADPADLTALAGPAAGILGKQLERLRRRRAALTPALTRAELIADADYCRALGRRTLAPWPRRHLARRPAPSGNCATWPRS
jgi:hypothetical protein